MFYQDMSAIYSIKVQTIRAWYYLLKKDPSIVEASVKPCCKEVYGQRIDHINKSNQPKITYSVEKEQQLIDWIEFCRQTGVVLVSRIIKRKACGVVKGKDLEFKASNRWFRLFLKRNDLRLRAPTSKSSKGKTFEEMHLMTDFVNFIKLIQDK